MPSLVDELERLTALKESGAISADEFEAAKRIAISQSSSAPDTIEPQAPEGYSSDQYEDGADAYGSRSKKLLLIAAGGIVALLLIAALIYLKPMPREVSNRSALVGNSNANCRSAGSESSSVIETIPSGTAVEIEDSVEGWSKVAKRDCWVSDTLLATVEPPATQPNPSKAMSDENDAIEHLTQKLSPAVYRFDLNPNQDAVRLATLLLSKSKQCVGGRGYGLGKTRVWLNFAYNEASTATIAMTGDILETTDADFSIQGLALSATDPGIDGLTKFNFGALRKTTSGDVVLFAYPDGMMWREGTPRPEWYFYCGDPNSGSEERRHEFAEAQRSIVLSDRD